MPELTNEMQFRSALNGFNPLKRGPSGYYQIDKGIYTQMSDNDCRKRVEELTAKRAAAESKKMAWTASTACWAGRTASFSAAMRRG